MNSKTITLALTMSVALAAGCGDDDEGGSDSATTGATTTMGTTTDPSTSTTDPGTTTDPSTTTDPGTTTDPSTTTDPGTTTDGTGTTTDGTGSTGTTGAAGLEFELDLAGYGAHNGQTVYVAVLDDQDAVILEAEGDVANDVLTITQNDEDIVDGDTYTVHWYADVDDDGTCDGPENGMDHAWEEADVDADATGLSVAHTHDTDFSQVCDTFNG